MEYKNSIPGRKKGKCNGELFYVGVAPSTKITMEGHGMATTGMDGGGQMPREVVGQCHSIVIWIERGKIVSVDAMATLVDSTWAPVGADKRVGSWYSRTDVLLFTVHCAWEPITSDMRWVYFELALRKPRTLFSPIWVQILLQRVCQ